MVNSSLLRVGELSVIGRMPWASNATLLGRVTLGDDEALVIYKPQRGERPLWDFPPGSLAGREVAAYEVSEALEWHIVPDTVMRDGPIGPGMVQRFVEHDPEDHFFALRDEACDRFRQFAIFDAVINNADRKGGHCLRSPDGHVFGIDHGVSFHEEPKLRTVIWDFAGEVLSADLVLGLTRLAGVLTGALGTKLSGLIATVEIDAVRDRIDGLLESGKFPVPAQDRVPVPYPLV